MKKILFTLILLFPFSAQAHVTANPNNGTAGKYFETKFRISHGCDGSDTVEIHLSLPKGTVTARPQAKAGWGVEVKKSKLDKPVPAGHGKMADEQIDEIIWKGGPLSDGQYDEFGLLTKLPEAEGILFFPVKQVCKVGVEDWKNVPANMDKWPDTDHPAPFVKITPDHSKMDMPAGHQH